MAVNHGSIATHVPQSLPSFAQAFSTQSLGSISSGNNSLPPIQTRLAPMDNRRVDSPSAVSKSRPASEESSGPTRTATRKRSRNDVTSTTRDDDHSNSDGSPRLVHIKEEHDQEMLDPTPPPPPRPVAASDVGGAPSPSSLHPHHPSKKRRVTISGAPHPLNTDVRVPVDQTNSTPISPVVMGFTIKRDNPSAIEQVRSMITVKQKQKALIEQRRGSVAGVLSPSVATGNPVPPAEVAPTKTTPSSRTLRRSPNTGAGIRRLANNPSQGKPRPPSPSPVTVPSQQQQQQPAVPPPPAQPIAAHSLPPPPISFARRRAGLLGANLKKPADIVISPREAHTREQFHPAIQSAPPVPHAGSGQSAYYSGRFPMTLPSLPPVMGGGDNVRRIASNVPPTPTRLAMQRNAQNTVNPQPITGRSPPAASVPIASTRVPPTPSSLQHPGYSGDKSAFLAPFEVFYDALNDSKQMKNWLGEQLQRSDALMRTLTQQQEKLNEVVENMVEKKVADIRSEMAGLHRRVEELEDALRVATSGRRQSVDAMGGPKLKSKTPHRNGITTGPMASETYTFPPVSNSVESSRPVRRPPSPGWGQDRDSRELQTAPEPENGSPAPFDSMRMSVSSSRLDPPRSQPSELPSQSRTSFAKQSPPQGFRETPNTNHTLPPPSTHGKAPQNSHPERDRQGTSRQSSSHGTPGTEQLGSPPQKRAESRRNSIIMSPPDSQVDDG
ncbi:hypothetical protein BDZ94DRAFT_1153390 [Collybia nuda]|uniref:Uncharacterized protein n=1 Tax=Collybia nuda TaxID=64659 RepID=A0A9P6CNR8_9AGAR|nr:hypothetical protein BDZ94DRAFT_1153390 [Collybia nuda]